MANSFVTALKKEIAALEKELAGDPRFKKLKRLVNALDVYLEEEEDGGEVASVEQATAPEESKTPPQGRAQMDKNSQILQIATGIISSRGGQTPIPTRDILDAVTRYGIEVHGREPRNTLSAILSYSKRFKAHGRSGWTMKTEDDDADESTEAADDPNLARRTSTASDEHRLTSGGTRAEPVKPWPGGGA